MRGLIPAHIMSYIEDRTGLQMADMVDIFAGPSTGAILNAALTRPHPDKPDRPMFRADIWLNFMNVKELRYFHLIVLESFAA